MFRSSALVALVLGFCASARGVSVSAQCNIYGAGHASVQANCSTSIGPGILPVEVDLPAAARWVQFQNVTGAVLYCASGCEPASGPDGISTSPISFDALDGISGIGGTRARFFEAVFLSDAEPADPAPAALNFTDFSFTQLSPLIAQHFFVGDGLTGAGSGAVQCFAVPAGATRLFLGFSDGFPPCVGAYSDNSGSIDADVVIFGIVQQPVAAAACNSGNASFSIGVSGSGSFMYVWQLEISPGLWVSLANDPMPLPCGGFAIATPIDSPAVSIGVRNCPGVYQVRCVVTGACGSMTSDAATLTVLDGLRGDTNGDGARNGEDVQGFVGALLAGPSGPASPARCAADMNLDGLVNTADLPLLVNCLVDAGCP